MIEQPIEHYEYDEAGDVLDVYFGQKRPAWTIELTDHIMLSLDRQTEQVAALSFLDFSELIRPTPLGPRSFSAHRPGRLAPGRTRSGHESLNHASR